MSTTVNSKQTNQTNTGLKHGQFKVKFPNDDISYIVNPLSQDEIAEGWQHVLPAATKKATIHHFSIYLSQLPPHLWKYLKKRTVEGNDEYYPVQDKIYHYSIKLTKHDRYVFALYEQVMKQYPDYDKVIQLYDYLDQYRIKGWIMTLAKNMLYI